jgi:Fe-only nitrogenase accessory protein AnfO
MTEEHEDKPAARIAVALSNDGALAPLTESERLAVFEGDGSGWRRLEDRPFSFDGALGLCGMRKRLSEYMDCLGKVDGLLARGFPGVSRDVLSRNGYVLYETEVFEAGVLYGILEHLSKGGQDDDEGEAPVFPFEAEPGSGSYFLDLRQALNANPDLTTKKVLRPFFQGVEFRELAFIYDHFPPWLPGDLKRLGLRHSSEAHKGGVLVRVFKEGG